MAVIAYNPFSVQAVQQQGFENKRRREEEAKERATVGLQLSAQKQLIKAQTTGEENLISAKAKTREDAFNRFRSFTEPYLQQIATGSQDDEAPVGLTDAQGNVISSIQEEGAEAQGELLTALARRGISRGGVSAAEAGKLASKTGANVALAKAQFEENEKQRRQNERIARQQAFSSLFQNVSSQLGAY